MEGKSLKFMKCRGCGYTWMYGGKATHASCPKCKLKNEYGDKRLLYRRIVNGRVITNRPARKLGGLRLRALS